MIMKTLNIKIKKIAIIVRNIWLRRVGKIKNLNNNWRMKAYKKKMKNAI